MSDRIPHSAFNGATPDEMYLGTGANIAEELGAARSSGLKEPRERSKQVNRRSTRCHVISLVIVVASAVAVLGASSLLVFYEEVYCGLIVVGDVGSCTYPVVRGDVGDPDKFVAIQAEAMSSAKQELRSSGGNRGVLRCFRIRSSWWPLPEFRSRLESDVQDVCRSAREIANHASWLLFVREKREGCYPYALEASKQGSIAFDPAALRRLGVTFEYSRTVSGFELVVFVDKVATHRVDESLAVQVVGL